MQFENDENRKLIFYYYEKGKNNSWVQQIKGNAKELYNYINETYEGNSFAEKCYLFANNLGTKRLCYCKCGNTVTYRGFKQGYSSECKSCACKNPNKQLTIKKTLLQKYGVDKINDIESYKIKRQKYLNDDEWIKKMVNNGRKTKLEKGSILHHSQRSDYENYKLMVRRFTNKVDLTQLPNHHLKGPNKDDYSLDHKFSSFEGFKNNIPPFIIGSIHNLEYIKSSTNSSKAAKCSISLTELLNNFYNNSN